MATALDAFVSVPVSIELFMRLAQRWPNGVSTGIEDVLVDFLERTQKDFEAKQAPQEGLHWEALFLPHGTQLRTKYFGEHLIASIEDGKIFWDGQEYASISRVASAMRGNTSNNAWKVMEVKRPQDRKWQVADYLRK